MDNVFGPKGFMIFMQYDKKFDWFGLACGLVYQYMWWCVVKKCKGGQNSKTNEEHG